MKFKESINPNRPLVMKRNLTSVFAITSEVTKGSFRFTSSLKNKCESYLVILCIAIDTNDEYFCFAFKLQ